MSAILSAYQTDAFNLKQHLQDFLQLTPTDLNQKFETALQDLAELGRRDFDWDAATEFYQDKVGEAHLFELAAWHLSSKDYIGDTIKLATDRVSGIVLDFGGGIGTHAIATAMSDRVEKVHYCDINPVNYEFVKYRVDRLGLSDRISCHLALPADLKFDAIVCLDVLEHLPAPSEQLLEFHRLLNSQGQIVLNWYFFKGFDREFPFHLDDPIQVDRFFTTLQQHFLEVFHPYFITTRCYRKISSPALTMSVEQK
jgi:2-polyprenyl-3-methyl-5-hydroxy-6-metoxy-1,4-benzoquinol methylase